MDLQFSAEILPDNERTEKIMKKRADEEETRRMKAEEMKAMEEKKEKNRKLKEKNEQADRAKREKLKAEAEANKAAEENANKEKEGKMVVMLENLHFNTTPFEYNCSGLALPSAKCNILAKHIAYNKSLLSIDMNRKNFNDIDG